jgi:hypothetical protein
MDFRTDNNPRGITYLLKELGDRAPKYLNTKEASEVDAVTRFASPGTKEYPYNNPNQLWHSYAYLKTANDKSMSAASKRTIGNILKLAADIQGVSDDLCEIDMILEQAGQGAHPIRKFALHIKRADTVHKLFPIHSASSVRNSAHELANNPDMPIEWMKQASEEIVNAAEYYGVDRDELPERVTRLGVPREPNFEKAACVAEDRGTMFGDEELAQLYGEIVKSAEADSEDQLGNYIDLMIDLDRAQGLNHYPRGVIDPYSAFYSGLETEVVEKAASDNVFIQDTLIPTEAFRNTQEYVQTFFSKKAAANITAIFDECGNDGIALSRKLSQLPVQTQRELARLAVKHG